MQRSVDHYHSFLDEVSMPSGSSPAVDSYSSSSSGSSQHSDGSAFGEPIAFFEQAQVDIKEHSMCSTGSEEEEQIRPWWNLSTTLREVLRDQCRCAWRSWLEWCNGYPQPKTSPSVGQFSKYLWHLYSDRRMAWWSIRLHRASIVTIVDPLTNSSLSQHPMVTRFMTAVFLARSWCPSER